MRTAVLAGMASALAGAIAMAVAKFLCRRLVRKVREAIQLVREFRAFLEWRKHGGGEGPMSPADPGTAS